MKINLARVRELRKQEHLYLRQVAYNFPTIKKGYKQSLKDAIQEYYTYVPYKPKVQLKATG